MNVFTDLEGNEREVFLFQVTNVGVWVRDLSLLLLNLQFIYLISTQILINYGAHILC